MFSIPLYALLILYILFTLVFFVFFLINVYHIFVTGTFSAATLLVTIIILALATGTIFETFYLLSDVSWSQPIISFDTNLFPGFGPQSF